MHTLRAPSQNVLPSSYFESAAPPAGWVVGAASRGNRLTRAKWQCQNSSAGDHWTACALLGPLQAPSACHVSVGPFRGEEGELPSKCRGQGLVLGMGGRGMDPGSPGRGRTRNFGVLSLAGVFFLAPVASLVPELPSLGFENTTIPFNWACLIHTTSGIIWPSRMGDFDRRSLPLHFSRHSFFDDRFCLLLERSTTATADPCRS